MMRFGMLLSLLFVLCAFSCENEPLEGDFNVDEDNISCEEVVQNIIEAATNFGLATESNYSELCTAYVEALQNQITVCGDTTGSIQAVIDGLGDCTFNNSDNCAIATTIVEQAGVAFNNATNEDYTTLCTSYKNALASQILICGDINGSIQAIIDSLGDCSNGNGTGSFAMTFKLNGELYQINNPFGNNEASSTTIYSYYPEDEYILLQGRNGLAGPIEIDIWINRDHMVAGASYDVDMDTWAVTTHIDFINNSNSIDEQTISGQITITSLNTTTKSIQGTFEFNTVDDNSSDIDFYITEGTFNFIYDVD